MKKAEKRYLALFFINLPNDHMTDARPEDGYPFRASLRESTVVAEVRIGQPASTRSMCYAMNSYRVTGDLLQRTMFRRRPLASLTGLP